MWIPNFDFDHWIAEGCPSVIDGLEGEKARIAAKEFIGARFDGFRWGDRTRKGRAFFRHIDREVYRLGKLYPDLPAQVVEDLTARNDMAFAAWMDQQSRRGNGNGREGK